MSSRSGSAHRRRNSVVANTSQNNSHGGIGNNWQLPSNERCRACSNLLSICQCSFNNNNDHHHHHQQNRSSNISRNLEELQSKTEFAKNAFKRKVLALNSEYEEGRVLIKRAFETGRARFAAYWEFAMDLCDTEESARRVRDNIYRRFTNERTKLFDEFHSGCKFIRLSDLEKYRRRGIVQEEVRVHIRNVNQFVFEDSFARLITNEAHSRDLFEKEEEETADQLFLINERLRKRSENFVNDCEELERQYFRIYYEIHAEFETGQRAIKEFLHHRQLATLEHERERVSLIDSFEDSLKRLEVYEDEKRSGIRRVFSEELYELESLLSFQREERLKFFNEETSSREMIRSSELSRYGALVDYCAQDRETVLLELERRESEVRQFITDAISEMHEVMDEEENERQELSIFEDQHKEETHRWVLHKKLVLDRLCQELRRFRNSIIHQEETEFEYISQKMGDELLFVQLRIEAHENSINRLVEDESTVRYQLEHNRESDLNFLELDMEESLTYLSHTIATRSAHRNSLFQHEADSRREIMQIEYKKRKLIIEEEFERGAHDILDQETRFGEHVSELNQEAEDAGLIIEGDEDVDFTNLMNKFESGKQDIIERIFEEQLNECMDYESQFRQAGVEQEREDRQNLESFALSEIRCQVMKEQAEFEALLDGIIEEENDARDYIACESEEDSSELAAWNYAEVQRIKEDLEARKEEERVERERYENELVFGDGQDRDGDDYDDGQYFMTTASFNNNKNENNNNHNHNKIMTSRSVSFSKASRSVSQNHPFQPRASDLSGRITLADVRRSVSLTAANNRQVNLAYVARVLNRNDINRLSDDQLNLFVEMLEKSADRRHQAEIDSAASENALRLVEKDINRLDTKADSKRDTAEHYKAKLEEQAAKHAQQMAQLKEATLRQKKQAKIEEERTKMAHEKNKELDEAMEQCKDEIRNRYNNNNNNSTNSTFSSGKNFVNRSVTRTRSANNNNTTSSRRI